MSARCWEEPVRLALVLGALLAAGSLLSGCGRRGEEAKGPARDAFDLRLERARRAHDAERLRHVLAQLVLEPTVSAERRERWLEELRPLNEKLVWDPQVEGHGERFQTVTVRDRDTYWDIARRMPREVGPLSPLFLQALNRKPAARLRAGDRLKVPARPVSLRVCRDRFELALLLDGGLIASWPIGLGREDRMPGGLYEAGGLTKNPRWTDPKTKRTYRYGEPGHAIGSRWIGMHREGRPTGFGIHGTDEPGSIGGLGERGGVSMRPGDLEELYDLVCEGTEIVVIP